MDEQLVTVLVGVGVVALIGLVVFLRWRLTPSKEQKKKAMDFLKGLEEALYARILEIIKTFNIDDYKDLASLEIDLLSKIKEVAKAYILDELKKSDQDLFTVLMLKFLSTDMIEKFILSLIDNHKIVDLIEQRAASKFKSVEEIEAEDAEKVKEFSSDDYNEEFDEIKDLEPAEEPEPTEEELAQLNPQKDEEEEYNPNDESMEVIDDDLYIDASGRLRSKKTNKWVKSK